jgi:hypothetical protein
MTYRGVGDRRAVFALVVLVTIAVSGYYVWVSFTALQLCSEPLHDATDHVKTLDGKVVSDRWSVTGYLLDREVTSPWTDYGTLRDNYTVRYALTTEQRPYYQDAAFSNSCRTYYVYDLTRPT